MLYYIGYLPPKEFQEFYKVLIGGISQKFKLNRLAQKRRMAHVTFKSPFESDSPGALDYLLTDFCQCKKASLMGVNGVGTFENGVLYLRVQPSAEMRDTFRALLGNLRDSGINFNEYDIPGKKMHITVAKREELEGKFQDIYDYLAERDIRLTLPFDNLALFQKQERTQVYRIYKLH